jgi:hypothetical protein
MGDILNGLDSVGSTESESARRTEDAGFTPAYTPSGKREDMVKRRKI